MVTNGKKSLCVFMELYVVCGTMHGTIKLRLSGDWHWLRLGHVERNDIRCIIKSILHVLNEIANQRHTNED